MTKPLKIGTRFGTWTVTGEPRAGGNARVYPVGSPEVPLAALKLLNRQSVESVERFRREVEVVRKLPAHANLVRIVDISPKSADPPWYVMEWVDNGSLADNRERFAGQLLASISLVLGVARGLTALHSAGIIHRDIKPDNVLLRSPDVAVLADLGLCWLGDFSTERLTPEERATGAWGFRAPEHEHQRVEEVSESADVFSLVKMLWWLISGGPPFASAHFQDSKFDLAAKYNDVRMHSITVLMSKTIVADPSRRVIRSASNLERELITLLQQLDSPSAGRVSSLVQQHFAAKDRVEADFLARQERERKIEAVFPQLRKTWRDAAERVLSEVHEAAASKDRKVHVSLLDQDHPQRTPNCIGMKVGNAMAYLEFGMAYSADLRQNVIMFIKLRFNVSGRDFANRLKVPLEYDRRLAGSDSFLIVKGDKQELPVDPTSLWEALIEKMLPFA